MESLGSRQALALLIRFRMNRQCTIRFHPKPRATSHRELFGAHWAGKGPRTNHPVWTIAGH